MHQRIGERAPEDREQPLVALYFIDPRGRPDPRTFSDPTFYTQLLLEVTARKGG